MFTPPARGEIEAAVAPYIMHRMPLASREWQEASGRLARKERRCYTVHRLRRLLPGASRGRPQVHVSAQYETHCARPAWPRTRDPSPGEQGAHCVWGDEGMLVRRYGRKRGHHLQSARLIEPLQPHSVLEVGFGNGINLLVMSTLFPRVAWSGVELTEAGVMVARSVQQEPELPAVLRDFAPLPVVDPMAHRAVTFWQGDAAKLPFADRSFDLVVTFQALEQMQSVRDRAVAEIARVARRHVALTEPLADFNRTSVQRHSMRSRGYLDLASADLPRFDLQPVMLCDDFPQKLTLGVGFALCELHGSSSG